MPKLIATRGLPASGKSTWALQQVAKDPANWARVNKDDLRQMLNGGIFLKGVTEEMVLAARHTSIDSLLKRGFNVIADDTNFTAHNIKTLKKIAYKNWAEFEVRDFIDISLEDCIKRDLNRLNSVGEDVIRDMHRRFIKGKKIPLSIPDIGYDTVSPEIYIPTNFRAKKAFLCDLDGTFTKFNGRGPYDEHLVHTDVPNTAVVNIVKVHSVLGYWPIFMSGRTYDCMRATITQIETFAGLRSEDYELHMRTPGDSRSDNVVKLELFNRHIRDREDIQVVFSLDDRDQVVRLWRMMGITCLQVDFGDF